MAATSWRNLFVIAALVAVTKVTTSTWRDAFSAPPRNLVRRSAQTAKGPGWRWKLRQFRKHKIQF